MLTTTSARRAAGTTAAALALAVVATLFNAMPASAAGPTLTVNGTAIKATWTAVGGAKNYTLQYDDDSKFGSPDTVTTTDTTAFANYLAPSKTYYLRVITNNTDGTKSTGSANHATTGSLPTAERVTNVTADNANGKSIELSWTGTPATWAYLVRTRPSGGSAADDIWTESSATYQTVTGLTKSTKYTVWVYAARDDTIGGWPAYIITNKASTSISVTTSSYDLDAVNDFAVAKQHANRLDLSWTEPNSMQSGWSYQVQYALNTAMTRGASSWIDAGSGTSYTLTGLSANTPYYLRIRVVDSAGKQRSDKSGYVMGKTIIATGTITGHVSGAPSGDLVAEAYEVTADSIDDYDSASTLEMVDSSPVDANGNYSLTVRPGTKVKVRVSYIGTGNYYPGWAPAGDGAGRTSASAAVLSAGLEETVTAPNVTLGKGTTVTGVITGGGSGVQGVDVTFLSDTTPREVIVKTRTVSGGKYTAEGIPDGDYVVRMKYSTDGFTTNNPRITIENGAITSGGTTSSTLNANLDLLDWYRRYGARILGTKRVGKTLTAKAPQWVAGTHPATWSSRTYYWKRNGVVVGSGSTYKLTSADRGTRISLTVKHSRTGYVDKYVSTRSYRIG